MPSSPLLRVEDKQLENMTESLKKLRSYHQQEYPECHSSTRRSLPGGASAILTDEVETSRVQNCFGAPGGHEHVHHTAPMERKPRPSRCRRPRGRWAPCRPAVTAGSARLRRAKTALRRWASPGSFELRAAASVCPSCSAHALGLGAARQQLAEHLHTLPGSHHLSDRKTCDLHASGC